MMFTRSILQTFPQSSSYFLESGESPVEFNIKFCGFEQCLAAQQAGHSVLTAFKGIVR